MARREPEKPRWPRSVSYTHLLTITADYCTIVTFDCLDPEIKIQFEETPYDPVKQIPKGRHYNAKFMIDVYKRQNMH